MWVKVTRPFGKPCMQAGLSTRLAVSQKLLLSRAKLLRVPVTWQVLVGSAARDWEDRVPEHENLEARLTCQ